MNRQAVFIRNPKHSVESGLVTCVDVGQIYLEVRENRYYEVMDTDPRFIYVTALDGERVASAEHDLFINNYQWIANTAKDFFERQSAKLQVGDSVQISYYGSPWYGAVGKIISISPGHTHRVEFPDGQIISVWESHVQFLVPMVTSQAVQGPKPVGHVQIDGAGRITYNGKRIDSLKKLRGIHHDQWFVTEPGQSIKEYNHLWNTGDRFSRSSESPLPSTCPHEYVAYYGLSPVPQYEYCRHCNSRKS